jgi:hypothetical protein
VRRITANQWFGWGFVAVAVTSYVVALLFGSPQRDRSATPPPTNRATDAGLEKYRRFVAEAQRREAESDVLLTVDDTRGEHSVRLLRPAVASLTNELSTAADFQALAIVLPKHDTAVIQLWAVGWDTNRVTNAAAQLRRAGFRSIRLTAMRWGQSTPGPEL